MRLGLRWGGRGADPAQQTDAEDRPRSDACLAAAADDPERAQQKSAEALRANTRLVRLPLSLIASILADDTFDVVVHRDSQDVGDFSLGSRSQLRREVAASIRELVKGRRPSG
jgi:hypothetical protein